MPVVLTRPLNGVMVTYRSYTNLEKPNYKPNIARACTIYVHLCLWISLHVQQSCCHLVLNMNQKMALSKQVLLKITAENFRETPLMENCRHGSLSHWEGRSDPFTTGSKNVMYLKVSNIYFSARLITRWLIDPTNTPAIVRSAH